MNVRTPRTSVTETILKLVCLSLLALGLPLAARAQLVPYPSPYTTSIFTTNTLFIEAEDADFTGGKFVTTTNIGMNGPYPGGSYANLGTVQDYDFDWICQSSSAPNGQTYRAGTLLSAGKEKGSAGNDRGTFTVKDWWTLGWNSSGDWANYTRVFPSTPQNYFVFAHVGSGGPNVTLEMDQVTSGVGSDDTLQVKKPLGYVIPGRATAGWDSLEIFPMTDTNGNIITVNLSGQTTLRWVCMTNDAGAADLDYYAYVPATVPLFSVSAVTRDQVTVVLVDVPGTPGVTVDATSIGLTLNGSTVTGTPVKNKGVTTVTVSANPLLVQGATNTVVATYKDTTAKSYTSSGTFVVNTFVTRNTMFIEFEDCDYNHGQWVTTTNIGMNGVYPGGSYTNLGTLNDAEFDWHVGSASGPNGQVYRADTSLSAGKPNGSAGNDRGYFQVQSWWTLGWNSAGDWANYTRQFPPSNQWYEVYGHLASGGGAIDIRLEQVTSGVGQAGSNQTVKALGYFSPGRATAGWDSLEVFPLIGAEYPVGKQTVVQLNGLITLKAHQLGTEDMDYMAFVPVTLPPATINITSQPQGLTVPQNGFASFNVAATTTGNYGLSYQWNRNGTPINNANSTTYTIPTVVLADNGAQFTVTVNSPGAPAVTSAAAVLNVVNDTNPPVVLSAGSLQNYGGGNEIGVVFSKQMTGADLMNAANFTLDNGATVTSARYVTNSSGFTIFLADGTAIPNRQQGAVLQVSTLNPSTAYHLTVKNVHDSLNNVLASQTLPVAQAPFTWVGMGNVATNTANPNGVDNEAFAVGTNSFNLVNGGNAFWGTEDDITMVYEKITGDFDKTTQVEWNDPSSNWARAGISARENIDPTNAVADPNDPNLVPPRYQMVISDPKTKFDGTPANDAYETNRRLNPGDSTTSNNGGGNPSYPGSYVRLKRVGDNISMFFGVNGVSWAPAGTTDFSTNNTAITTPTNISPTLYVGPTLGVENGNILGQGGTVDQTGDFAARFRNYGNMVQKAPGKAAYAVGLNFGANEGGAQLATNDVAGVDQVAQADWNNIFGNAPVNVTGIVADKAGAAVATPIVVSVNGSPNTWASIGLGGHVDTPPWGNIGGMVGNDQILLTGYLDSGAPSTTQVIINGIPSDLTSAGYDVVLYSVGTIPARGGGYRVANAATNTIQGYYKMQAPTNPTNFVQCIPDPTGVNWNPGTFLVFTNITASSIVVEATTDLNLGLGGTMRAPINAIQLVAPSGLISSAPRPTISIAKQGGNYVITYTGTLVSSSTVNGTYTPVTGASNPYTVPISAARIQFYKASSP